MNHPLLVGVLEGLGDLGNDPCGGLHAQRAVAADQLPQVHPRHVLRHHVVHVEVVPLVKGMNEVRVIELRQGLKFAAEVGQASGVQRSRGRTLMATVRPLVACCALKTCPIPPWPRESTMRYGPRVNFVRPSNNCFACHVLIAPISVRRRANS